MVGYQEYEDDIFYIQGVEKSIEEGIEKGIEKGKITTIRNLLKKGFDPLSIADVVEAEVPYVLDIKEQLKKEPIIQTLLKKKNANPDKIAEQQGVSPTVVRVIWQHTKK